VKAKATEVIQVNAEKNAGIYRENKKNPPLNNNVQHNNKHEITHQNTKIELHADLLCTPQQTLSIHTAPPMLN